MVVVVALARGTRNESLILSNRFVSFLIKYVSPKRHKEAIL